jgi:hypothetical protein
MTFLSQKFLIIKIKIFSLKEVTYNHYLKKNCQCEVGLTTEAFFVGTK